MSSQVQAPNNLTGLSRTLQSQFADWLDRRKPQEEKMLRAYQDMMRIARDDDTKEVGVSRAQKSKVFVGSTRGKIRSARAKIKDSLFGSGELPFDTKPSNEKLKIFADTVEEIISYQFEEGKVRKVLGTGVDSIATYGTGFIFGPFVKSMSKTSVEAVDAGGYQKLREKKFEYDCPTYEHARTMDVYPDPEAEDPREGNGVFWASRKQPAFIRNLKGQKGYDDEAIERALNEKVTAYTDQGSDRTDQARMNIYRYTQQGRIWFVRFFGLVKKRELREWRKESGSQPSNDDEERIEAVVIMAGGQVIKADENPYKEKKRPVRRCVYEDVEHEMWGVGVAENNDPNQRVINAAFRLFVEGKAYAMLPVCSIDRSAFDIAEDYKLFPGKRYLMKPNLTPEQRKDAIIWHQIPDVTDGWEKVIALSEQFSDDDTAITKYTQGNDAQHLNKTAAGMSMIMNASSLPTKEVLANIDEMWIEDMVEDLIDWDLENLEPETVKEILGEKQAQVWAQIKEYGKTNFMEWFATGAATFMAKEVLMHKLQGFLQIVLGSEHALQEIDLNELLQQIWDAGQIGKESPILDDEEKQKKAQNPANAQAMEHIKEIEDKATKLIQQAQEQAKAAEAKAAQAQQMESYKRDELASKERSEHLKMVLALVSAGPAAAKTLAEIDKLQAETVLTDKQAAVVPSPEMVKAAAEKEKDESGSAGKAGADSAAAAGSTSSVGDTQAASGAETA